MRTSQEIYHRVRWDARFDASRFVLGVEMRGREPKRVPLPSFDPHGDIPWHRVLFFEADGRLVWDRASGLDALDASGAGLAQRVAVAGRPVLRAAYAARFHRRSLAAGNQRFLSCHSGWTCGSSRGTPCGTATTRT